MSDGQNPDLSDSEVFDIDRIRDLVELMKEHDLSEIDLRHSSRRIRVRRGNEPTYANVPVAAPMMQAPPAVASGPAEPSPSSEDDNANYIKSPMVGTFYTAPKPDAPNFIKVGDHVDADTIVCLVEAMKMFNEIPAGISGKIVALVARNEEAVDVGMPLYKIIPD